MSWYITIDLALTVIPGKEAEFSRALAEASGEEDVRSLKETCREWSFEGDYVTDEPVVGMPPVPHFHIDEFTGEKSRDEDRFFEIAAPFLVEDLSYAFINSEDGGQQRVTFREGKPVIDVAERLYPDELERRAAEIHRKELDVLRAGLDAKEAMIEHLHSVIKGLEEKIASLHEEASGADI